MDKNKNFKHLKARHQQIVMTTKKFKTHTSEMSYATHGPCLTVALKLDWNILIMKCEIRAQKFPWMENSKVPYNYPPTEWASQPQGTGAGSPSPRNLHKCVEVDLV